MIKVVLAGMVPSPPPPVPHLVCLHQLFPVWVGQKCYIHRVTVLLEVCN